MTTRCQNTLPIVTMAASPPLEPPPEAAGGLAAGWFALGDAVKRNQEAHGGAWSTPEAALDVQCCARCGGFQPDNGRFNFPGVFLCRNPYVHYRFAFRCDDVGPQSPVYCSYVNCDPPIQIVE